MTEDHERLIRDYLDCGGEITKLPAVPRKAKRPTIRRGKFQAMRDRKPGHGRMS